MLTRGNYLSQQVGIKQDGRQNTWKSEQVGMEGFKVYYGSRMLQRRGRDKDSLGRWAFDCRSETLDEKDTRYPNFKSSTSIVGFPTRVEHLAKLSSVEREDLSLVNARGMTRVEHGVATLHGCTGRSSCTCRASDMLKLDT